MADEDLNIQTVIDWLVDGAPPARLPQEVLLALSHRLVSLGLSTRSAVAVIYLITFCLGMGAVTLAEATPVETFLILLQSAGIVIFVMILLFFERRSVPRPQAAA